MLNERLSPTVISAVAAAKLPRIALLVLLTVFIAPQLLSPDLWSGRNMISFGVAWQMSQGGLSDWLLPNIDGTAVTSTGPLTAWVAAILISTLGKLISPVAAFHLSSGLWYLLTTATIWYGTYLLGRRDEVQPLSFAFGGEAARKDYGRLLADIALLMFVATYGLVLALHDITPVTTLLALSATCFFGIVLSLEDLKRGSVIAGFAIGAASTASTLGAAIWITLSAWLAIFLTPDYTSRTKRAVITLLTALVVSLIWPALVFIVNPQQGALWFANWFSSSLTTFAPLPPNEYLTLIKNMVWLAFPVWPFAMWGVWAWRKSLRIAPVSVPMAFACVGVFSILFTGLDASSTILCVIPSLCVLSALGITSLHRSQENLIDGFSVATYTLGLVAVWLYFYAWTTGTPPKMAFSIHRLAPHVKEGANILRTIIAVLTTLTWCAMVYWRVRRHPQNAWRGAWLAACGLTAVFVCVMSLFGNLIDGARSMAPIGKALKEAMVEPGCVQTEKMSLSDRAAFRYFASANFEQGPCRYQLRIIEKNTVGTSKIDANWMLVRRIPGRPRSDRYFELFERVH